MGFSQLGFGNVHDCWIENGYIYQETKYTKQVYKYATRLPTNIHKQCNLFMSDTVMFLLYENGLMYIGRSDGVISIYDANTEMLVGLNNWDAPSAFDFPTEIVGFFKAPTGMFPLRIDLRDKKTVYSDYCGLEGLLPKTVLKAHSVGVGMQGSFISVPMMSACILDERGERVAVDVWNIQEDVWRRNCRIFL